MVHKLTLGLQLIKKHFIYACRTNKYIYIYIYIYIYTNLCIQLTHDKSDTQGTGKSVRLSEMSELSEIHKNRCEFRVQSSY